jgi:hypothetical protein
LDRRRGADAFHLLAVDANRWHEDKAPGITIRRWCEEHAFHQTEHGRRGADAERERERRDGGESRTLEQHANGEANILQHGRLHA